jgi:hypothetical protein
MQRGHLGSGYSTEDENPEEADRDRVDKVLAALKSDRGKVKSQRRIKPVTTNNSSEDRGDVQQHRGQAKCT